MRIDCVYMGMDINNMRKTTSENFIVVNFDSIIDIFKRNESKNIPFRDLEKKWQFELKYIV